MGSADHAASVTQALNRICRHVLSQMVLCQFCRLSVFGAVLSCAAAVAVSAIFTIMITPDILGSALLPMMCCMCVSMITEIVEAVFLNG